MDRFSIKRGRANDDLHRVWRVARQKTLGFVAPDHPYSQQGEGKAYTYKLFLEQAHCLLREGARLGFIVPSGLYSDHGSGALRALFLERCRWEWLFGFENRDKIFDIDSRFKFNPVIIEKGGATEAIRTAFMRRKLEDWERAEALSTPYTLEQVEQFSPRSKAILEIQSARDLEILEKIYADSVLLGDDGPDGWGIKYAQGDFNMTSDSKLFPPRPKWEEAGYRPDEYSRWLKGDWRPIEELWTHLGIDPSRPVPIDPSCEEEIAARGQEVQKTDSRLRCAQPPYDALPIPRADIPEGIILSREADTWIEEGEIGDLALPLYVGKMINVLRWAADPADQDEFALNPDYLLGASDARHDVLLGARIVFRDIARTTDQRTCIAALIPSLPCGNVLPLLELGSPDPERKLELVTVLASYVFDWAVRLRMSGTHLNWHVVESLALPIHSPVASSLARCAARLSFDFPNFCSDVLLLGPDAPLRREGGQTPHEVLRLRANLDASAAAVLGLDGQDLVTVLEHCDHQRPAPLSLPAKGFWRVDKDKDPELRHTVLTLVAFHDLEEKIRSCGGDREKGIEAFLAQNDGEGWMLPETLRLADYGLGHDDRARHPQPVATRLGPRFYDWQLAQTPDESWRECRLHARNLLGDKGYAQLGQRSNQGQGRVSSEGDAYEGERGGQPPEHGQGVLFE